MTTDELRTWMKALEERDVRIVAVEKRLQLLELSCFAQQAAKPQRWAQDDAYAQAAAEHFGVPLQEVTSQQRAQAKGQTFPFRVMRLTGLEPNVQNLQPEQRGYRFHVPERPRSARDLMVGRVARLIAVCGVKQGDPIDEVYCLEQIMRDLRDPTALPLADWKNAGKPSAEAWAAACDMLHAHADIVPPAYRPGNAGYPPGQRPQ